MQAQVKTLMEEVWKTYGNEIGSLTVCGHSLVRLINLEPYEHAHQNKSGRSCFDVQVTFQS